MDDMLQRALTALDLNDKIRAIADCDQLSTTWIETARQHLKQKYKSDIIDLVAFGSVARRQATCESDLDYLVIATGVPDPLSLPENLLRESDNLRRILPKSTGCDNELKEPGTSRVFGCAIGAFGLISQIGLECDTNHSLTRRMLFLQESVSLLNSSVHEQIVKSLIERYLSVSPERGYESIPHFLLNDVLRYWRTIAVDCQAKAGYAFTSSSTMRNLKLRIPRKIAYAGTLMSLLLSEAHSESQADYLYSQFSLSPLTRLLQIAEELPDQLKNELRTVVNILEWWLAKSGDRSWREHIEKFPPGDSSLKYEHSLTQDLQKALESIFFEWESIHPAARKYLAF